MDLEANMSDDATRRARAGLTQVIEPADALGVIGAQAWGPIRLLEIIEGATPNQDDWRKLVAREAGDVCQRHQMRSKLGEALARWRRRSKYLNPDKALDFIGRRGGRFIMPEDDHWPTALADLDVTEPLGLWTLGDAVIPALGQVIGLVGSREATPYGEAATKMLATKARELGLSVLSGGAYGIDAEAHRSALATHGPGLPTISVLAGGLDQLYPAGNVDLLRQVARDGVLVSEMPPGMRPNRYRFLNRNRLIAALAATTIVVEARYRSGAINTANHAHDLNRTVGAVPGPIHLPSSAGCHRLIKETPTLLIDDAIDLEAIYGVAASTIIDQQNHEDIRGHDQLEVHELLVFEALPIQGRTAVGHLCGITGLAVPVITGVLAKLERCKLAEQSSGLWRKHRNTKP